MRKIKLIILLLFLFSSCDSYDDRLIIINKSSNRIYCFTQLGLQKHYLPENSPQGTELISKWMIDSLYKSKKYPDFVKETCQACKRYLEPNDTTREGLTNQYWPEEVKKAGVLSIVIFNADTVEQNEWSEVVKHKKFVKRFLLTEEELTKLNWKVIYQ